MNNFNKDRGGRGGFKPNFRGGRPGGRPSFGGDRDDRPREMFDATCSSCGNACQVPFRPTGEKPVFCRDCFAKQGGGRELGRQAGFAGASQNRQASFAPNSGNAPSSGSASLVSNEVKKQLELANAKLEKLVTILEAFIINYNNSTMAKGQDRRKEKKKPKKGK